MRLTLATLCCLIGAMLAPGQTDASNSAPRSDYSVFEFRRYTIKAGEREHFASRFEIGRAHV